MKSLLIIPLLLLSTYFTSNVQAQTAPAEMSPEELAIAISLDTTFQEYTAEMLRYHERLDGNPMSDAEMELFHQQQKERVEKVKAKFPALEKVSKEEKQKIISNATRIAKADIQQE